MQEGQCVLGKKFMLYNGAQIPATGVSTYRVRSERSVYNLVDQALSAGYRLFDTSALFGNEVALRHAFANLLPKYRLERTDIYVTSKLIAMEQYDYTSIRNAFEETLTNLGLDYIDLYLVSSSVGMEVKSAWSAMQILHEEGYAISIGVANFTVDQLRQIMVDSTVPMVNQVEWHPMKRNNELHAFCTEHNIHVQGYSPFGTPLCNHKHLLKNAVINKLAGKYEVPSSQIMLMWCLQQNVSVIVTTSKPDHLKENIDFDLKLLKRDIRKISAIAPDPNDPDGVI